MTFVKNLTKYIFGKGHGFFSAKLKERVMALVSYLDTGERFIAVMTLNRPQVSMCPVIDW